MDTRSFWKNDLPLRAINGDADFQGTVYASHRSTGRFVARVYFLGGVAAGTIPTCSSLV